MRYAVAGLDSALYQALLDDGWEVYGYSQYASDGRPSKVELKKESISAVAE